jgi:hypothetical protein
MKGFSMKLNHVSTFSGEGQFVMLYCGAKFKVNDFRKK